MEPSSPRSRQSSFGTDACNWAEAAILRLTSVGWKLEDSFVAIWVRRVYGGVEQKERCKKVQVSFWKRYWTISCSPRWKGFSFSFGSWTFDFGCFWCVFHLSSRKLDLRINHQWLFVGVKELLSVCGLGSEVSDSSRIPSSALSFRHSVGFRGMTWWDQSGFMMMFYHPLNIWMHESWVLLESNGKDDFYLDHRDKS